MLLQRLSLQPARQRHRPQPRRSRGRRRAASAFRSDPAVLCAGRPGDGDRATIAEGLKRYMANAIERVRRQPGADRPLSARRHRGRCRLPGRRRDGVSSPASWSISKRPASIPATRPAPCRRIRWPRSIAEIAARPSSLARALNVVGLMNVQFAVKDGDDLHSRSQSARQPHRAVRRQGHRHPDRQDRGAGDGRRKAGRVQAGRKRRRSTMSRSRKRCSPSRASPASTSCSGRK